MYIFYRKILKTFAAAYVVVTLAKISTPALAIVKHVL